uniref:receptor protein-tyrosine kinase n=1 Tax=Nomascus leucogenys TaxID=61853 RepID=A0A2I3H4K0_NOMLE
DGAEAEHGQLGLLLLPPPPPQRLRLLLAALASLLLPESAAAGLKLMGAPEKLTLVKLNCSVEGMEEPDIQWVKDGAVVQNLEQLCIPVSEHFLSLKSVVCSDRGQYWCQVDGGKTEISQPVWLTVEGVPLFTVEPKDLAVPPNAPFQLSCKAVGPPEPVTIVWWRGTTKIRGPAPSPSVLNVTAHSLKCLASSRIATVLLQAFPAVPFNITVTKLSSGNTSVAWMPGADGRALLQSCTVQVTQAPGGWEVLAVVVLVPPFTCLLRDLVPATSYSLRVCCANSLGPSPYADWVPFQTKGLAPASVPQNLHAIHTDSGLILEWEEVIPEGPLEGPLGPYKLSWVQDNGTQDELTMEGTRANLTGWDPQKGLIVHVCVSNAVGCGPWSQPLVVSSHDHAGQKGPPHSRTSWVPVVLGVLTALVMVAALALILLLKRRKEMWFGQGFDSVMAWGEPAIHFRAARSFNRERPNWRMCSSQIWFSVVGPAEAGGWLLCESGCEDAEIPQGSSLHEGPLSLWGRAKGCHPIPMVILLFMKHGDLHAFLLTSHSRNFIHRDLAAQNCMLAEDMTVCVADFGLSWKIYSGDYYCQGCASKLPVKWLALESLADNLYTVHSDVWAFGVTMWEIMTRGQMPYAGIKNAEIYNYLIGGNRLKQLPEPSDDLLYDRMYQCWSADPKQRPSFACLQMELENILGQLSVLSASQDPLYINIKRAEEPTVGGSLELPSRYQPYSGAGDGSGMGAVGGTPRLAEQPGQAEHQPESPLNETQRLLLLQQGLLPHNSC